MTSAEKFEILSAYLDDEASDEERHLVEQWIEQDPQFRQQYQAQIKLKAAIRRLPSSLFGDALSNCDRPTVDELADDLKYEITLPSRLSQTLPSAAARKPSPYSLLQPSAQATTAQFRWKDTLLVLAALSAAAIATFCYASAERTRWVQPNRAPGRVKRTDTRADGVLCHQPFRSAVESC